MTPPIECGFYIADPGDSYGDLNGLLAIQLARFANYWSLKAVSWQKVARAGIDLASFDFQKALDTETLNGVASQDGPVHHRPPEIMFAETSGACEVAHEAACEAVAGARRVIHLFQRKCGNGKQELVVNHESAVLSPLDHERARPHPEDALGRAQKIMLPRELASFLVVDHPEYRCASASL